MYSKLQSIWAPSATYKINKWTQTEQSHITQLKQYSLSHLVYNTHLLTITDQATGGKHDRESVGVTAGGYCKQVWQLQRSFKHRGKGQDHRNIYFWG